LKNTKEGDEMKAYLITIYWEPTGKIEFDIVETKAEEGTEEFREMVEEYEHNQNIVLVTEVDDSLLSELRQLNEKLNNILLKRRI